MHAREEHVWVFSRRETRAKDAGDGKRTSDIVDAGAVWRITTLIHCISVREQLAKNRVDLYSPELF